MGAKYLGRNVDVLATNGRLVVIGLQGGDQASSTSAPCSPSGWRCSRRRCARGRAAEKATIVAGSASTCGRWSRPARCARSCTRGTRWRGRRGAPGARGERPHRQAPAHHGVTGPGGWPARGGTGRGWPRPALDITDVDRRRAVLTALVGLVHVYVVVLEMVLWDTPRGGPPSGPRRQHAAQTRVLAAQPGAVQRLPRRRHRPGARSGRPSTGSRSPCSRWGASPWPGSTGRRRRAVGSCSCRRCPRCWRWARCRA